MSENTETAVVKKTESMVLPEQMTADDFSSKMDAILEEIESRAGNQILGIGTAKDRKQIASVAHGIARAKTHLDNMGKEIKAEAKKIVDETDMTRRKMRARLDELKTKIRKPLTDFEDAEKLRAAEAQAKIDAEAHAKAEVEAAIDTAFDSLADYGVGIDRLSLDGLLVFRERVEAIDPASGAFGDRVEEATTLRADVWGKIEAQINLAKAEEESSPVDTGAPIETLLPKEDPPTYVDPDCAVVVPDENGEPDYPEMAPTKAFDTPVSAPREEKAPVVFAPLTRRQKAAYNQEAITAVLTIIDEGHESIVCAQRIVFAILNGQIPHAYVSYHQGDQS